MSVSARRVKQQGWLRRFLPCYSVVYEISILDTSLTIEQGDFQMVARESVSSGELLMSLDSRQRGAVLAHLLNLSNDDRSDRFACIASDDYVAKYVGGIVFTRDLVVGALRGSKLIGVAHGAVYLERGDLVTEIGISIDAEHRTGGLGKRLMRAFMDLARKCKIVRAYVIFRSGNSPMSGLVRAIGGRVERDGCESSAVFSLNESQGVPMTAKHCPAGGEAVHAIHPQSRGRVLLVHGAGGDSFQWVSAMAPALYRAGYSVCAPTLPGHGRSGNPTHARLAELLNCVAANATEFESDVIVGHSMGGYLVQRYLEKASVRKAVLLASLPPTVPAEDDLSHVKAELHCAHSSAVIDSALPAAPNVDVQAASRGSVVVIGGTRDRVVPAPWVRYTARRYCVQPHMVEGGHRLMMGRAASTVAEAIAA